MNLSANSRYLVFAGAWLATAVVAFCVGRLASEGAGEAPAKVRSEAGAQAVSAAAAEAERARAEALASLSPRWVEGDSAKDRSASTPDVVTGGRPMEEWLKDLLSQDDEIIRATGFLRLLETLNTSADLAKAMEAIKAVSGRGRDRGRSREFVMLLQKWTGIDPKAAIAYAAESGGNEERWAATSTVLRTWARANPDEALAWAQANGASTGGNGNPQDGNWAVAAVVSQLARTDITRALDVAASQPVSRARGRMIDTLVGELFSQQGAEAAQAAVLNLPAGPFRDGMTAQVANRLARDNGAQTAEWVLSLPAGDGRTRALAEVVNEWADDDPVAAGNFLSRIPASAETDPSRERYAWQVLRRDPESAMAWASTISEEGQRSRAVEGLVRQWMRRDPDGARNWVTASPLSDAAKARMLGRN